MFNSIAAPVYMQKKAERHRQTGLGGESAHGGDEKTRIRWNYKWQWQTVVNWSRYFIYAVIGCINIWKAAVLVCHVWKNVPVLPPSAHRCIPPPNSVPEHHFPKHSVKSTNSKEAEKALSWPFVSVCRFLSV